MSLAVNLLPLSYRQARMRHRRIRLCAAISAALLTAELFVGLLLHARAGRVRDLLAAADAARATAQTVRLKMTAPTQEAAVLGQQLALARRLRTTHHWSRLLGVYSNATGSQITLTAVSTDPARWSPSLGAAEMNVAPTKGKTEAPRVLEGLTVRGCAKDHMDVSNFIKSVNEAKAFETLNLLDVRRDKYMDQDVIAFEIQCRW